MVKSQVSILPTVGIAGATGFVGRALLRSLGTEQPIVALSRHAPAQSASPNITWRSANLFNMLHTERALQGVHTAYYLVHSMSPQAALTQGNFADMDLICADNFARAAKRAGVKHIIYLGGIVPTGEHLSAHLRSRCEVEQALGEQGVPVTTLRAGLIIGPGGSSFRMMSLLVRRLPLMLTPAWTRSHTQPVALQDAVGLLKYALYHPETAGRAWDIGCPEVLTYEAMMHRTAWAMGKTLRTFTVPIASLNLSLLWVSLLTQTPRQLVMPLVQSLRHEMVARDGLALQQLAGMAPTPFDTALRDALYADATPPATKTQRAANKARTPAVRTVVSVQRLTLPKHTNARWVTEEYARWLPRFMWPWLKVQVINGDSYRFTLPGTSWALLELTFSPERSSPTRQMYYVSGGKLAMAPQPEPGRFEFRAVLGETHVLSAVHDFVPRLPWYLYKATQALAHAGVMYFFGRHLDRLPPQEPPRERVEADEEIGAGDLPPRANPPTEAAHAGR